MRDEGVGDRADHRGVALAERGVEDVLQPDDVRLAGGIGLVVHPVIGGERDHRAQRLEPPEALVELLVEASRLALGRRVLVLDEIGERQVHEVAALALEQLDAGFEHEQRQLHRVHVGQRHADQLEDVLDAVLGERAPVRALRGKAHVAPGQIEILAQLLAQLVLGGDGDDLGAGGGEPGQDRVPAQELGAGHHHRLAGRGVEVVVAGDAVLRRGRPGDDRHVVGAGEARHRAVGDRREPLPHEPRDVGDRAVGQELAQIGGVAAVDAHHDHRLVRPAVPDAVHLHRRCVACRHGRFRILSGSCGRPGTPKQVPDNSGIEPWFL